jgi:glycogen phosphorylase
MSATSQETKRKTRGVDALVQAIQNHARYSLVKSPAGLSAKDLLRACELTVREALADTMLETEAGYRKADAKRLYYLSMEFLMGRSLSNNLRNLGLYDECKEAVEKMGFDLEETMEYEPDAALGNGGLGRLAACFLDSLASLGMPGFGYGINYEYGLFKQEILNGNQREQPDRWRAGTSPWLIDRPDDVCLVPVYGRVEHTSDRNGNYNPMWLDWKIILGTPADLPVVGFGGKTINYLRLFSASSPLEFDMEVFNQGDYIRAVEQHISTGTVSKVLYPSDRIEAGRELRLIQEYFLVACAIRDVIKRYQAAHSSLDEFPSKVAIQLNDTHPAMAVAELMRALLDENDLSWDDAWEITVATLGYTNHTLMPEALERWSIGLFERVLPRHLQIILEINHRFLQRVERVWPGDSGRLRRMSIVEEGDDKHLRMANLAIVGSHSVNGVAKLHSELVKSSLVPDFYQMWPDRFNNKTNGVTQRRWLLDANPLLADLVTSKLGSGWITKLNNLRNLEPLAGDCGFQADFAAVKRSNKERLAGLIANTNRVSVDPGSLFDIQVKRFHEYKRQLLNVLRIIHQYLEVVEDGKEPAVPRTYIFAGKAAPGYWQAKQIIKLINNIGAAINSDHRVRDMLKVVLVPDYKVSLAEVIIPAADLSEQISTAGMEASGTGNMKFAMNGALTIGTLDGANIEIMEEVGADNIFIFGLKADEIQLIRERGSYCPRSLYEQDSNIRRVLDTFLNDRFCPREPGLFQWLFDSLTGDDHYFHLADFPSYLDAQARVDREYIDHPLWTRKAILNVARIGKFSSDRTIEEYATGIWGLAPVLAQIDSH